MLLLNYNCIVTYTKEMLSNQGKTLVLVYLVKFKKTTLIQSAIVCKEEM